MTAVYKNFLGVHLCSDSFEVNNRLQNKGLPTSRKRQFHEDLTVYRMNVALGPCLIDMRIKYEIQSRSVILSNCNAKICVLLKHAREIGNKFIKFES